MEIGSADVAVVTGSGGAGCGRAIALRVAALGSAVVVSDVDDSGGRETVRLIESAGGRATFVRCDVRDAEQVRALIDSAERTYGRLTVLVNNATGPFRPDEPLDHWLAVVETDFLGAMYAMRFAIDAMRRAGRGAIVNITSISALWHGRRFDARAPIYDAAKAGLLRLTTALDWLQREGIRVNAVAPGWIATDGPRQYWESLSLEERRSRGVPARLLETSEIAAAVVHLANDETLAGRVLVWWSDDEPKLIRWTDRGYADADPYPIRS